MDIQIVPRAQATEEFRQIINMCISEMCVSPRQKLQQQRGHSAARHFAVTK